MIETILTSSNLISAVAGSISTGLVAYFSFLKAKDKDKVSFQQMEREYMESLRANFEQMFRDEQAQLRNAFNQERIWLGTRIQELESREYVLQSRLASLETEFESYKQAVSQVIQTKDIQINKLSEQLQAAHKAIYLSEQAKLEGKTKPNTLPSPKVPPKSDW